MVGLTPPEVNQVQKTLGRERIDGRGKGQGPFSRTHRKFRTKKQSHAVRGTDLTKGRELTEHPWKGNTEHNYCITNLEFKYNIKNIKLLGNKEKTGTESGYI